MSDGRTRCSWADFSGERWAADDSVLYRNYHDTEWGQPLRGDRELFERMTLEAFQSGLSWLIILRKRDNFRTAFQRFDADVIARFGDGDVERLMADGKAYEAWETNEELDALRESAKKAKRPFLYKRANYSDDQLKRFRDEGRKSVIRFVMPVKEYRFTDVVAGREIVQSPYESQDFVIR